MIAVQRVRDSMGKETLNPTRLSCGLPINFRFSPKGNRSTQGTLAYLLSVWFNSEGAIIRCVLRKDYSCCSLQNGLENRNAHGEAAAGVKEKAHRALKQIMTKRTETREWSQERLGKRMGKTS